MEHAPLVLIAFLAPSVNKAVNSVTKDLRSISRKSSVKEDRFVKKDRISYSFYEEVEALRSYCITHTISVDEWMQDIGSGLNYKRKDFNRLMEMVELGQVKRIVIAHKDRFVRFGYGYFEAFCIRHNCEVVVINGEAMSPEQELVQDLIAIVTVFAARLHGLRSYKKVIRDAALHKDQA